MIQITYYGHSCFGLKLAGFQVLIDPFIRDNPLARSIDPRDQEADFIFLTHGHGDHIDDVMTIAGRETPIITNFEVANWFGEKGFNGIGMNYGGIWSGPFGKVRLVAAIHSSSLPDGSYGGNPCGFVFMLKEKTFYIAGDTALTLDMKLIPELCGPVDFAVLPVGGYYTMNAEDAVRAATFVQTKKVIGCHFDTFPMIKIDHEEAVELFSRAGLNLKLPAIGERFVIE